MNLWTSGIVSSLLELVISLYYIYYFYGNIIMYTNYVVHPLAFFFVFSYIKKKCVLILKQNNY